MLKSYQFSSNIDKNYALTSTCIIVSDRNKVMKGLSVAFLASTEASDHTIRHFARFA